MTVPAVAVVLVSWNTRDLLDACLANLRPQLESCGGEVWVVDNDSADGSADMVESRHPWAHLVRNDANVGFARACNLVFPRISSPFIFLFNPDALLDDGCLKALMEVMTAHPRLGALMPRLLNADGTPTHFVGRAPRLMAAYMRIQRALTWKFDHIPAVRRNWERSVDRYLGASAATGGPYYRKALEGAALMVRKEAMDSVGVFDPDFFCGYEETDLTLRMRASGWELAVTPSAGVRHWDQQSRIQWSSRPWEIPDGFYFVRKHKGRIGLLARFLAERRRLKYHAAAGETVEALGAEQIRAFKALWRSPEHPGMPPQA